MEAGLIFADAAAAKQELMGAMNRMLTLHKQNVAARRIFHLAMAPLKRKLDLRLVILVIHDRVVMKFKQHYSATHDN